MLNKTPAESIFEAMKSGPQPEWQNASLPYKECLHMHINTYVRHVCNGLAYLSTNNPST